MQEHSVKNPETRRKLSGIGRIYIIKLAVRILLFIAALAVFLWDKTLIAGNIYHIGANNGTYLLVIIWVYFVIEMVFRFFPSRYESRGSEKQFLKNYLPRHNSTDDIRHTKKRYLKDVLGVGAVWLGVLAVIAVLYYTGVIDEAVLLLASLFFAVCDIICILFYCPFQSIIMKNRCCVTCRIFNWDFLMMFSPLVFIPAYYTLSLFAIAFVLFIRWEAAYYRHPERFCEETNENLGCAACTEKLCIYKKPAGK